MESKFKIGDKVWYYGGYHSAYLPGIYEIVDFYFSSPILHAQTKTGRWQNVVADKIERPTPEQKALYGV